MIQITAKWATKGTTGDVTTCQFCGRSGLRKTVVLVALDADGNPDGDPWYAGTTCGARRVGVTVYRLRKAAALADQGMATLPIPSGPVTLVPAAASTAGRIIHTIPAPPAAMSTATVTVETTYTGTDGAARAYKLTDGTVSWTVRASDGDVSWFSDWSRADEFTTSVACGHYSADCGGCLRYTGPVPADAVALTLAA